MTSNHTHNAKTRLIKVELFLAPRCRPPFSPNQAVFGRGTATTGQMGQTRLVRSCAMRQNAHGNPGSRKSGLRGAEMVPLRTVGVL